MHQLCIVTSLHLLLPVIQTFFFGAEIYNPQKKKSAKIKCLLFRPKPQKFHTAEITAYTVVCVTLATMAKGSTGLAIYTSWTVEQIGRDIFPLMTITLIVNY